ncbi:D-serine deaminase-like pyridoxal phosphate-dependent protein [Mucilaginibacter oryzae]|uniref:D-serine deaminase-like pyridoxal phosphate-dependent protein n=1 Tax=Mucilaginibacter oryzae TaxID=468058 RepID=A0A316HGN7_9SPHI|nr:D-TA family PLP-dependent enzyme [Mucilaginibacter oryzae]PWK77395.1 D-serine deaminase-like pyridoxal phosphate-dependent protein [Mucilaginibacter oryzae]
MATNWYNIQYPDKLDTPALVVYPDRVKNNITTLAGMIDDVSRLRPHVKTYKNAEVTGLLLQAGINKFKCATIAEAELLAISKAPDILLAYQPEGPKLHRFIRLIHAYPKIRFACLVDNATSAKEISDAAERYKLKINVYLDLNVGMNRTGIPAGFEALQLYMDCGVLPGVVPVGLHAYDGHIHDVDLQKRAERCNFAFDPVFKLQQDLKQKGYPEPVVVAGGSPTFPIHAKRTNVECSPGTFVYWDKGYQQAMPEQEFLPAALVITRVISLPGPTRLCLDVGHKSVSAENELNKRIYFLNAPELSPVSQSEEHLVVEAGNNHQYQVGDVLYGIPHHICPTVALYERAYTIENEDISGEWLNKARDRKITI